MLSLQDLRHEVSLADPQISPDGSHVALLVGVNDFEHNAVAIHVDMVDAATGARHPLPLPFDEVESVRWSPDGTALAFLAAKSGGSHATLHELAGGRRHCVSSPAGSQDVEYFAWRPDGKAIAFVRADPPPRASGAAKFRTNFVVGDNDYLTTAAPLPSHLWLVSVAAHPQYQRLTSGSFSLPSGSYRVLAAISRTRLSNPSTCPITSFAGTRMIVTSRSRKCPTRIWRTRTRRP